MGQTQSDDYQGETEEQDSGPTRDVGDSEINTKEAVVASKSDVRERNFLSKTRRLPLNEQESKCSTNSKASAAIASIATTSRIKAEQQQKQHVRKLSNLSHRNIQLLSMKPRSEKDAYADDLRDRRRSSLINLILGAPSSGPRFCDDLCSLSSRISECNFGIEFFPDNYQVATSTSSLRFESSIEDIEQGVNGTKNGPSRPVSSQKRRRSSLSNLAAQLSELVSENPPGKDKKPQTPSAVSQAQHQAASNNIHRAQRKPSLASTLASIDLISSFEQHDKSGGQISRPPLTKTKTVLENVPSLETGREGKLKMSKSRINQAGRILRRTGSELSLYSNLSASSAAPSQRSSISNAKQHSDSVKETKLIIMLQVCLPFMLAGFGNMSAGLVLNRVAQWRAFQQVPIFFVLLPPLVGLKGNIEMTLASRLSTMSNLKLLDSKHQWKRAYLSNLVLVLSQAIGLSVFAATASIICELLIGSPHVDRTNIGHLLELAGVVVVPSALATSIVLVLISSIMMPVAICLAKIIQVNPDNLSTLIAALYGDVSCVLVYGLIADKMFLLRELNMITWPLIIISSTLLAWPILLFIAYKFKETHSIAISSMIPMFASIIISIGSGALLSLFIGRFKLIALYQPIVNGFGANLIAVQASRVSTWLWCSALRKIPTAELETPKKLAGSLASFVTPTPIMEDKPASPSSMIEKLVAIIKTILWSFCNSSPNAIAARLLLVMIIPAHTIYFFVIILLSPSNYIVITWQLYIMYIGLCLIQVSILLTICEPLMALLMKRHLDPDIFGISILMALADLTGTLCLVSAFSLLARLGDVNVS